MSDVYSDSVELHRKNQGKLGVAPIVEVKDKAALSLVYTPGVAQVSREIAQDKNLSFDLTWRGRVVAVLSDGSAVLGLGNIGAEAAMPVMEGKALLFKQFGGVEAVPLCIDLHTTDEIVAFVRAVAPSFGGINLEDIAAPLCFEIEYRLQDLGIPVIHDDQHGTAITVSAALMNAAQVVGKRYEDLTVVISGAGSAGLAIAQMLLSVERVGGELVSVPGTRVKDVILVDSRGIITSASEGLKGKFAAISNQTKKQGDLAVAMTGADAFIGVSKAGLVTPDMVKSMHTSAIVLAMANPDPEILPDLALSAGAAVVGTGRSDYPNQINNSLVFPGLFRGLLRARATKLSVGMKQAARDALASFVKPTAGKILPSMFDAGQAEAIAHVVEAAVLQEGLTRHS